MSDLDHIFTELTEIRQKLDALPSDAAEERARLEHRRQELHAEASGQAEAGDTRPTHEIEVELASLHERVAQIEASGIDIVKQYGGSALEASTASDGTDLNRRVESGQGADELRARIAKLEGVLTDRAESSG